MQNSQEPRYFLHKKYKFARRFQEKIPPKQLPKNRILTFRWSTSSKTDSGFFVLVYFPFKQSVLSETFNSPKLFWENSAPLKRWLGSALLLIPKAHYRATKLHWRNNLRQPALYPFGKPKSSSKALVAGQESKSPRTVKHAPHFFFRLPARLAEGLWGCTQT